MPRRYYDYPARFQSLHVISTIGAFALASGLIVTLGYLLVALFSGRRAGDNPWGSRSFEWRTASPPPKHNWGSPPVFDVGAYDYDREEGSHHG
jgi:cytochrome c oxidase subunit 1